MCATFSGGALLSLFSHSSDADGIDVAEFCTVVVRGRPKMSWQFTVGLRVKEKADRIVVDAEDALIAALKVKAERPEATILYVRRSNRRGDTRHPPHTLTEGR